MGRIKNMGTSTMRFKEGIIVTGSAGGSEYSLLVTGSALINESLVVNGPVIDKYGSELVGGIYEIDQGLFQNPNSSYNPIFFPSDDSYIERVGVSSVNYFIAPFDGEVIKIQIRTSTDFSTKALTASFHKNGNGSNAYNATPSSTVAINGLNPYETHTFDFTNVSGTSLSEGDIFGFALELEGGYAGNESIHFTTVVKYDPYSSI